MSWLCSPPRSERNPRAFMGRIWPASAVADSRKWLPACLATGLPAGRPAFAILDADQDLPIFAGGRAASWPVRICAFHGPACVQARAIEGLGPVDLCGSPSSVFGPCLEHASEQTDLPEPLRGRISPCSSAMGGSCAASRVGRHFSALQRPPLKPLSFSIPAKPVREASHLSLHGNASP